MGAPRGATDGSSTPPAARPTPVILVHGTFGDRKNLLENLSKAIKAAGFCVFSLDYGNRGTGDVRASARQLKRFVGRVLDATGAARVSMVGHSQGGMMPRWYLKFLGGADGVTPALPVAWSDVLMLSPCPLLAATVALVAARITALARLRGGR